MEKIETIYSKRWGKWVKFINFSSLLQTKRCNVKWLWFDGSEKFLIYWWCRRRRCRLQFIRSLNCRIDLLGCYCNWPVIFSMYLNCLYFVINCSRGFFRFFIIFCWCMQRTNGRLRSTPLSSSIASYTYESFSFFFTFLFPSLLLASPIFLCQFLVFRSRYFV